MCKATDLSDLQVDQCRELVQRKVKRFFGGRLSHHDFEDACSQTMTSVLGKLSRFDPDRGSLIGYLHGVIDCSVIDVARHLSGERQTRERRCYSLNSRVQAADESSADYAATLDERILRRHRGGPSLPADAVMAMKADLRVAAEGLTKHELALLYGKLSGASNTELAKQFAVTRGTIHRRIETLRRRLAALGEYVK